MRVTVSFLGVLRDQLGLRSVDVDLPDGAVFAELLEALAPTLDPKMGPWAWDSKTHRFSPRLAVSRKSALGRIELTSPLSDGDEIVVLPPLAGG